jgi:hypothetical protein
MEMSPTEHVFLGEQEKVASERDQTRRIGADAHPHSVHVSRDLEPLLPHSAQARLRGICRTVEMYGGNS